MTSSSAAAGVSAQTSDLFRLLLETVKDYAIFIISPEGYVLTWSPGAEALKGYKREEIVGQHFSKFLSAGSGRKRIACPCGSWRSRRTDRASEDRSRHCWYARTHPSI